MPWREICSMDEKMLLMAAQAARSLADRDMIGGRSRRV